MSIFVLSIRLRECWGRKEVGGDRGDEGDGDMPHLHTGEEAELKHTQSSPRRQDRAPRTPSKPTRMGTAFRGTYVLAPCSPRPWSCRRLRGEPDRPRCGRRVRSDKPVGQVGQGKGQDEPPRTRWNSREVNQFKQYVERASPGPSG